MLLFGVLVIGVIVLRRRRTAAKVQTTLSAEEQARRQPVEERQMIDFGFAAGLLPLAALAFLLIPLLVAVAPRPRKTVPPRTSRFIRSVIAELAGQQAAGTLTAEQLENGRAEATRELLADTEGSGERA
ncbi:c-type cytochrome biogenesis protein CcmI [Pseudomonas aeruginosa]|nr:c-type cytochrome biogenesis protein CcmI [Pseudomonas aeruginosa]